MSIESERSEPESTTSDSREATKEESMKQVYMTGLGVLLPTLHMAGAGGVEPHIGIPESQLHHCGPVVCTTTPGKACQLSLTGRLVFVSLTLKGNF